MAINKYSCTVNVTRNRNFTDVFTMQTISTWNMSDESSTISELSQDTNVTETTQLPSLEAENVTATEYEEPSTIYRKTGEHISNTDEISYSCLEIKYKIIGTDFLLRNFKKVITAAFVVLFWDQILYF